MYILKYSYFARQPILDIDKKTIAYELLFRDGPNNSFPDIDPNLATSQLLSDHFLTAQQDAIGDKLGFVNFPYLSLINEVPALFPAKSLVVEILEDCQPTEELLNAVRSLAKQGYKIALDDFVPSKEWRAFLPYVSIIKFDIRIVPIEKAKLYIQKLAKTKIEFLAEKVETLQEFEQAKQAGFKYFQGYFFSKPEVIQKKSLEPSLLTVIQLITEVANSELDLVKIEDLIAKDVTLSYKLLSFVNSSYLITKKIESFRQALIYLGEERLRKFISLVSISTTKDDKPDYLYTLSMQRAKFCQMIAQCPSMKVSSSQAFLTGMFSLLDSLLDRPLKQIVDEMPIEETVTNALLEHQGKLGTLLRLVKAYEKAEWDKAAIYTEQLKLNEDQIAKAYEESVKWTAELLDVEL